MVWSDIVLQQGPVLSVEMRHLEPKRMDMQPSQPSFVFIKRVEILEEIRL